MNKDMDKKLEELNTKRKELSARESMRLTQQERSQQSDTHLQGHYQEALTRNTILVQDVQREMAKLRTLQTSPVLAGLQVLKDQYLAL
nr:uncharacterized protein LOC128686725 [Cherax quadricarinatus]